MNKPDAEYNYSNKIFEDRYLVKKGDLLFAWSASLGAYIWRNNDAWLNQHIFKVIPKDNTEKSFLYYLLNKIVVELYAKTHGSGMVHITKGKFESTSIPLPPLPEQHLIVAKIEELFSELDNAVENLKKAKEQLKVYRQAVLKWAFEGKLTEEWRKERESQNTKYQSEKEEVRVAAEERTSYERKIGLTSIWKFVKVDKVIEKPKYGTSKKCTYESDGIGVLRIPNVVMGEINKDDLKFAMFNKDEKKEYALKEGDILTIRSNGSINIVGKCAFVKKTDEQYLFAGYLIRLRPINKLISSKYLLHCLSSSSLRNQIEIKAKSTSGVNNINAQEIKSLVIPFTELIEQNQIVQEIETRFSVSDKM